MRLRKRDIRRFATDRDPSVSTPGTAARPSLAHLRPFAPRVLLRRFAAYIMVGALAWVTLLSYAGDFFGNLPMVQSNLH